MSMDAKDAEKEPAMTDDAVKKGKENKSQGDKSIKERKDCEDSGPSPEEPGSIGLDILDDKGDEPPPDGGVRGWLVVLASFLVHFIVLGVQYSFGVYANFFVINGKGTSSTVSLVGSLGAAVLPAFGIMSGRLAERFGFRRMTLIGTVIVTVALVLASFATELWQLFLTQGLLFGFGASITYFPAVSVPAQYFDKKRSFATGVAVSGSGIGGVVLTLATQKLLDSVGFAMTMRITAASALVILLVACSLLNTRIPPRPSSKTDWTVLKDVRLLNLLGVSFFGTFALLIPLYFLPAFAKERLGLSSTQGASFISVYNGASAMGRVALGIWADSFMGKFNSLVLCMFGSALSMFVLWNVSYNEGMLYAFSAINGFFAGGFISLNPAILATLFGSYRLASMMGIIFTFSAIGNCAGAPIGGLLHDKFGFTTTICYAAVLMSLSFLFSVSVRMSVEKKIFIRV